MALKCADVFDIMNSPVPPEPQDDLSSFSRRSDDDLDIVFDDEMNATESSNDYSFTKIDVRKSGERCFFCSAIMIFQSYDLFRSVPGRLGLVPEPTARQPAVQNIQ